MVVLWVSGHCIVLLRHEWILVLIFKLELLDSELLSEQVLLNDEPTDLFKVGAEQDSWTTSVSYFKSIDHAEEGPESVLVHWFFRHLRSTQESVKFTCQNLLDHVATSVIIEPMIKEIVKIAQRLSVRIVKPELTHISLEHEVLAKVWILKFIILVSAV